VHFDRRFVPSGAIGHRALAVNLSDLAAMGATPRLATLSLAMPGALPLTEFEGLVEGLLALARRHATTVVGGNLSRSPGPLVVDVMVMGTHGRRGLSHALFGSVAESVLRRSSCPVLTVRSPKLPPGHRRVVSGQSMPTTV